MGREGASEEQLGKATASQTTEPLQEHRTTGPCPQNPTVSSKRKLRVLVRGLSGEAAAKAGD